MRLSAHSGQRNFRGFLTGISQVNLTGGKGPPVPWTGDERRDAGSFSHRMVWEGLRNTWLIVPETNENNNDQTVVQTSLRIYFLSSIITRECSLDACLRRTGPRNTVPAKSH
jgi:hypothetical protein